MCVGWYIMCEVGHVCGMVDCQGGTGGNGKER